MDRLTLRRRLCMDVRLAVLPFLFVIALSQIAPQTYAQDLRHYKDADRYRYLPRLPQGPENPPRLPRVPEAVVGDPEVLVKELKGLIFIDHQDSVAEGKLDDRGIQIRGGSLRMLESQSFHRMAEGYLGGPISIQRLNQLVRDIIVYYRRRDRPVVDVSVPEQDITDGVVQIVVTEGRVGEVRVEGACFFNPCVLVNQVCISPGDRIRESTLMSDLRWLYRNPYRQIDMELTPGAEPGETDVVFNVRDKLPWRFYAGYEDTGNRATGLERTFYGANWFNAFDRDDQVGYQYTASSDFDSLVAHSGFYSTALPNRDILSIYGSHANFNSNALGILANNGTTWQLLSRYHRELCPIGCYTHGLTIGADIKQTNTNLEFGGFTVFNSGADIAQVMLSYNGRKYDRLGSWSLVADAYYSPGGLSAGNRSSAFQVIRANATANYFYSRFNFERRIWMPMNLEFVTRFTGQLADGNLLPTEQLGFGGYNSVRGYDQYSVVGDSGYFVNLEMWTCPIHLGLTCCDELQMLAYYDFGDARNHTLLPGEDPSVDLQGIGTGLRYKIKPGFELRADYAWQISALAAQPNRRQRFHIGALISY